MADSEKPTDRDARGRFVPGNPGGPGGARKRAITFRQAAEEAITTEHVQAIVRKAARMALEGNLSAMRFVIERVSGRVAEAPTEAEPVDIKLPRLRTIKDCERAIESLIDGICKGRIEREPAKLLIDAVQVRLRSIEARDLETRLERLEDATSNMPEAQEEREPDPRFL